MEVRVQRATNRGNKIDEAHYAFIAITRDYLACASRNQADLSWFHLELQNRPTA